MASTCLRFPKGICCSMHWLPYTVNVHCRVELFLQTGSAHIYSKVHGAWTASDHVISVVSVLAVCLFLCICSVIL